MATEISASKPSSAKLEEPIAAAGFFRRNSNCNSGSDEDRIQIEKHTLSFAGSAASLKYASPKDLPGFPSTGLKRDDSAAGAAASIGWANQKVFEYWKPDPSPAASKAALLAKNYKAAPPWQPEQSTNGAKAALIAAKEGSRVQVWKPEASDWGNSAANQAFKSDRGGGLGPKVDYGYTTLGQQGSLIAATGAMLGNRKRSESTPTPKPTYPDEANATANALSAATHASNHGKKLSANLSTVSGASPFTNMPKEMFTSHPPVAPEVDEKRRSDVLHASAVAMARQMYTIQQKEIENAANSRLNEGQSAAISAQGKQKSNSVASDETQPMRLNSLQEAAQRLAQERLAKLHDESAQYREYRSYYGETSIPTSRLSIKGRVRRRASSDGKLDEDRQQSQRIRDQMSLFSSTLSRVDEKKRQKDREALMAAAQRNVTASLNGMDERVFKDTGKVGSSMLNEWEIKAQVAAQKKSDSRMENYGKVNIGGGKYVDRSVIDAAAARNVQPVLDEINDKAKKERVRQAELRLEQEANRRSVEAQKAREKEVKDISRKLKEQDKEAEKTRREEEKLAKADQKRVAKQDKRKSKEAISAQKLPEPEPAPQASVDPVFKTHVAEEPKPAFHEVGEKEPVENAAKFEAKHPVGTREASVAETKRDDSIMASTGFVAPVGLRTSMETETQERLDKIVAEGAKSPGPPDSPRGVKSWINTKFAWRQSKNQNLDPNKSSQTTTFVKGAAATEQPAAAMTVASDEIEVNAAPAPSTGDATMGATNDVETDRVTDEERPGRSIHPISPVSSMSAHHVSYGLERESLKNGEFEEVRDHFDEKLAPPPTFTAAKSSSPVRGSRFHEEMY